MTERHYDDDEVAAIFRAAAEGAEGSESRALPERRADGLTLVDLQSIGREVGISPSAIEQAARSLDRPRDATVSRTLLGLPIGVQRTVALDRRLTDAEWELLVVELRQVFGARGTIREHGSLREWSNGNLHAYVEPTPTGHQLRLGTTKGSARASVAAGSAAVGTLVVMAAIGATNGTLAVIAPGLAALATMGVGFLATGTLGLRRWARLRSEQMDGIVERLTLATRDDR
jgi:hypothetical protein